ncbi:MAG: tetratricopeptide repeat protein [Myxococcaceae bacterium]|nr:tetratricopeptide repeat protein [Myxococcaceae bacterium]MCI0673491.1 tetratricopeptide repeat protein [Myxococcaceae bacterium]
MRTPLRLLAIALFGLTACLHTPPPHKRAIESSDRCAQLIAQGDLAQAETHCDLGLEFAPDFAGLWVNKGLIHYRRGDVTVAKAAFEKALDLNPDQAQAHNNLGLLHRDARDFHGARESFLAALRVTPDYTEARYNLALTLLDLGEREQARKEYRTLVAVSGSRSASRDFAAVGHHDLGAMAYADGAFEDAAREFRQAAERDASFGKAHEGLGLSLLRLGRTAEARAAFTACLQAMPESAVCREGLSGDAPVAAQPTP